MSSWRCATRASYSPTSPPSDGPGIVAIGWTCPLTSLERDFRERAGRTAHEDGFIATYLSGVVYPEQYLVLAQGLVAASIVTSYALLLRRHVSGQHSLA